MKPLIDCDVLRYEIGFSGQFKNEEGEIVVRPFEFVAELFDEKIRQICDAVWATEPPTLYLTGKGNFRDKIATLKPYKGTRKTEKPFHFKNLTAYILSHYDVVVAQGMEADDLLCVEQTKRLKHLDTIICTRDKDLRQCQGMHYGWECGAQAGFGPKRVTEIGEINPHFKLDKVTGKEVLYKVSGDGLKFFYAQVIMGDSVDNIPGLQGAGPSLAYNLLVDCKTEEELFNAVLGAYTNKYGSSARERMLEQAQLCWMVRELDEEGQPVMWRMLDD